MENGTCRRWLAGFENMNSLTVKSVKATGNYLAIDFECKGRISKFFRTNRFYAEYNTSVEAVPEGILVVPFLGTVLPIVWANDAVIHVDAVDQVFLESMKAFKIALQKMYPKLSLDGELVARSSSTERLDFQSRSMMLFSGGIDSLATYIKHRNEHLTLVCIHGGDISLADNEAWKNAVGPVAEFAGNHKSPLRTVHSNFREMPDFLILRVFDDCINEDNGWYGRIMHGLSMLALCAPLAYVQKTGKLYIAASSTSEYSEAWGSHPLLDKVRWTGTQVIHDGYDLSRQEKLLVISEYVRNCDGRIRLRPCFDSATGNCGRCEKCGRTIIGLELAGIDPNKHGFEIKPDTFPHIKRQLQNGRWAFREDLTSMWEDIKRHAYLKNNVVHPEAKSLINWLETVDTSEFQTISNLAHPHDFGRKLIPFFSSMPSPIYRMSKRYYDFFRVILAFLG